jgi:transposase
MNQHIHFPLTTSQQRRLLFQTWEATGDVEEACRTAHVGRRTFYAWKPRFIAGSYAALEHFASRAPKKTRRTPAAVEQQVITLRQTHPAWGKQRIADELAKANNWVALVSPATVKRILRDASLWPIPATAAKKGASPL